MKFIPLTQNQFTFVSNKAFNKFGKYKWYAKWNHKSQTWYAFRWWRFAKGTKKKNWRDGATIIQLHREIMGLGRRGDKRQVDHIDHNGLNNLEENLRIVDNSHQHRNQIKRMPTASSIYKGVCFRRDGRRRPFRAKICINKKQINIGSYFTEIEAAQAYNEKATELFGHYALLNSI